MTLTMIGSPTSGDRACVRRFNALAIACRLITQDAMATPTVLVVDDEELIRWSLRERLKSEGYRRPRGGDRRGGARAVQDGVDLVLLDYRLPDTDGLSSCAS